MPGFWEAVDRAALGQPGAAAPRPRSLFEIDDALPGGLDIVDVETDAPPPREFGESLRPAPALSMPPRMERGNTDDAPRAADAMPTREQAAEALAPPQNAPARPAPVAATAPVSNAVAPLDAPHVVERVEVHRSEFPHGVDATLVPRVAEQHGAPHAMPAPETTESAAHAPPVIVTIDPPRADEPMPAHAQPLAPPSPGPARAVAEEPAPQPPLVIEIDRIEIRIESQHTSAAPAPRASHPAPAVSLDDFLTRQRAGER